MDLAKAAETLRGRLASLRTVPWSTLDVGHSARLVEITSGIRVAIDKWHTAGLVDAYNALNDLDSRLPLGNRAIPPQRPGSATDDPDRRWEELRINEILDSLVALAADRATASQSWQDEPLDEST